MGVENNGEFKPPIPKEKKSLKPNPENLPREEREKLWQEWLAADPRNKLSWLSFKKSLKE